MRINADFHVRVAVHAADLPWQASPMPGVDRRMLDRIGGEVARATALVRYAPGSAFSPHTHDGGEEFLVLEGVFQDEHGDYPAGTYVRNPPTSRHRPAAAPGCTILVKLWQFDPDDRSFVRIDTGKMEWLRDPDRTGVGVMPLFADDRETVRLERWAPNATIATNADGGLELLVLEGALTEGGDTLGPLGWLRLPAAAGLKATAGPEGAKLWVKTGHLLHVTEPGL